MTDEERFVALRRAYGTAILGFALRRVDSHDDAVDVVADVFLVAWRRLDDVPAGDGALPWLYATARHVVANHHRAERRRRQLAQRLRSTLPDMLSRVEQPNDPVEFAQIAAVFSGLRASDQEVLALVGWEGLDHRQLGAVLGCSPTAARIRLHRARRRFAAALEAEGIETKRRPTPRHPSDDSSPVGRGIRGASDA